MSAQVAADLRAAADVLERDGWTQGIFEDANGCHCVQGAIRVVAGGIDDPDYRRYTPAVRALWTFVGRGPLDWNDDPNRTAAEVTAALRAAADRAEADQWAPRCC